MLPAYVNKICYGNYRHLSREYSVLDYGLRIEVPEYDGPLLAPTIRDFLEKVREGKSIAYDRIVRHTSYKLEEK